MTLDQIIIELTTVGIHVKPGTDLAAEVANGRAGLSRRVYLTYVAAAALASLGGDLKEQITKAASLGVHFPGDPHKLADRLEALAASGQWLEVLAMCIVGMMGRKR